jgi:nicotinamide-nucleotide amidase
VRVATCSVGAELLTGEIVDTNASWMAGRVLETGCRMTAVVVVGDDRGEIVEGLEWLGDRADVILVGGGLGPTSDDLTRYAVADFAGVGLERRDELVAHLEAVYARLDRAMPPDALRQADIPVGAEVHQPFGSAAGFVVDAERAGRSVRVHVLPGVPWEYQGIADRDVLPDLVRRSEGTARVTRTIHVAGAGESWIGNALRELTDRLESEPDVELGYRAKSDEVQVRITATAATPAAAREQATAILDDAADRLGDRVTSVDGRQLEGLVAGLLRARDWTVATAETFTAGRLSAALSSTPEGLDRLRGGLVTPDPMDESGADDTETATRMADDVRKRFDADLGIAVTGAAPGDSTTGDSTAGDRAGTVTWAIAGPAADTLVDRAFINGDREIVRARAVAFVLEALRRRAGS